MTSVSIDLDSETSEDDVEQGGTVTGSGTISGSGDGTVTYEWIWKKPDTSMCGSGDLTTSMSGGSANIPAFTAFPTIYLGQYEVFVRIKNPTSMDSAKEYYNVVAAPLELVEANCYINPTSQTQGQNITVYYRINNPNPTASTAGLGCSIRPVGTQDWISDTPHDKTEVIPPGTHDFNRLFYLNPDQVNPGYYDVIWGLWDGTVGSSTMVDQYTKTGELYISPELSINDVQQNEGDSGTTDFTFSITLNGSSASPVQVTWNTQDDTATSPEDFASTSGTEVFNSPGTQTITIPVKGDLLYENNEQFYVKLTSPINAVIIDDTGIGTITNDDSQPTLSINDIQQNEGDSGTVDFTFTITLDGYSPSPVQVTWNTQDNTASSPEDFTSAAGTTVFNTSPGTQNITVSIKGDVLFESDEQFYVKLTSPINATISDDTGVGTILNDDLEDDIYDDGQGNDTNETASTIGMVDSVNPWNNNGLILLDYDWYVFETSGRGDNLSQVSIDFSTSQGEANLQLYRVDYKGDLQWVGESENDGTGSHEVDFNGWARGRYYILVYHNPGQSERVDYSLAIEGPSSSTQQYGVTVIVHGAIPPGGELAHDGGTHYEVLYNMASAIYQIAGTGQVYIYEMADELDGTPYTGLRPWTDFVYTWEFETYPDGNFNGEQIIIFDWAKYCREVANPDDGGAGWRSAAAQSLVSMLIQENLDDRPLHLIGHSLGGMVVSQASRQLLSLGKQVDHVTILDGEHEPEFAAVGGGWLSDPFASWWNPLTISSFNHPDSSDICNSYEGVGFVDNYYGNGSAFIDWGPYHDLYLRGDYVEGAWNLQLLEYDHGGIINDFYFNSITNSHNRGYKWARLAGDVKPNPPSQGSSAPVGEVTNIFNGFFEIGNYDAINMQFPGYVEGTEAPLIQEQNGNRYAKLTGSGYRNRFIHQMFFLPENASSIEWQHRILYASTDDLLTIRFEPLSGGTVTRQLSTSKIAYWTSTSIDVSSVAGEVGWLSFEIYSASGGIEATVLIDDVAVTTEVAGPLNDECQNAITLDYGVAYNGLTTNATGADVTSCTSNDIADVWHSFTPSVTGRYLISLQGSNYDTSLAVYDSCGGSEVACNDDYYQGNLSRIIVDLTEGATYYIRVSGYDESTGDYVIVVSLAADITKNGSVDFADLALLLESWLRNETSDKDIAPVDSISYTYGDEFVDLLDYAAFAEFWLKETQY